MKNIKIYIILFISFLFLTLILTYKPIKTNHVYSKKVIFSDYDLTKNSYNTVNKDKFIKKAEESLYNIFGAEFKKSKYKSVVNSVDTQAYKIGECISVDFLEEDVLKYSTLFDLYSGKLIGFYKSQLNQHSALNSDTLSEDTLSKLAKDFLIKINGQSEENINYKSSIIRYNPYFSIEFTDNNFYIYIELDPVSGDIISYQKLPFKFEG